MARQVALDHRIRVRPLDLQLPAPLVGMADTAGLNPAARQGVPVRIREGASHGDHRLVVNFRVVIPASRVRIPLVTLRAPCPVFTRTSKGG